MSNVEVKFVEFFAGVEAIVNDHMNANFANLPKPVMKYTQGKKYYKVIRDTSVFCFVNKENGDVLKAASWAAPAKHARGNLFDATNGLGTITPNGAAYLR